MPIVEDFHGQAAQDAFALWVLKEKRDGYYLEIGSNHPIENNNTYLMDTRYGWKGVMVEYRPEHLVQYQEHRPRAIHIIDDATQLAFVKVLEQLAPPDKCVDYLQIDLEVHNDSTMGALEQIEKTMEMGYKYAVVTFEHDAYVDARYETRERSRLVFDRNGYVRVFSDVRIDGNPFEDWYVHPELVDMERTERIRTMASLEWQQIIDRLRGMA